MFLVSNNNKIKTKNKKQANKQTTTEKVLGAMIFVSN